MKNNRSSSFGILNWILPALLLAMILACTLATAPRAQAAPPPATIELASTAMADGSTLLTPTLATLPGATVLAQVSAPATDTKPTAAASAPWFTNTELVSAIIALVMSLFGIWSHTEKKTAQKVSESLVAGIEAATKIPAVAAGEKAIKEKIKAVARDYGVQPVLARIVEDVTG